MIRVLWIRNAMFFFKNNAMCRPSLVAHFLLPPKRGMDGTAQDEKVTLHVQLFINKRRLDAAHHLQSVPIFPQFLEVPWKCCVTVMSVVERHRGLQPKQKGTQNQSDPQNKQSSLIIGRWATHQRKYVIIPSFFQSRVVPLIFGRWVR